MASTLNHRIKKLYTYNNNRYTPIFKCKLCGAKVKLRQRMWHIRSRHPRKCYQAYGKHIITGPKPKNIKNVVKWKN